MDRNQANDNFNKIVSIGGARTYVSLASQGSYCTLAISASVNLASEPGWRCRLALSSTARFFKT
jgi:hypothetical protein